MILKQYNLHLITHEIPTGADTVEDIIYYFDKISKEGIQKDYGDNSMENKLLLRSNTLIIRFDHKSFFKTLLGFTP